MPQDVWSRRKKDAFAAGRADWLEPFENWVLTARNAGEVALKGTPQEKRVLAQKVFGSNLVLDCKKARGSCVKPWSLLVENSSSGGMVRGAGFEPANGGVLNNLLWLIVATFVSFTTKPKYINPSACQCLYCQYRPRTN
jgi:hypothetical protein